MAALLDTSVGGSTHLKIIPQAEKLGQGWEQGQDVLRFPTNVPLGV